ncbi:ribonuclease HI [Novosphingobium resinovorum]|uniref:ribonuclease HI n=1 Tax=Novosphingobium resinovorum TaxID=158500 RepID=UPI002ED46CFA|nr:reverse transcriptase-like protein [Novosphingobium resinovorum]
MKRLKVFFDGGCRPNPGPIEVAVVIRGVAHVFEDCGCGTNSDAEWLALIRALELCRQQRLEHVELIGDAVEIIRQANRALRDGTGPQAHAARFLELAAQVGPDRLRWIRREQNLAGIALAARHPR